MKDGPSSAIDVHLIVLPGKITGKGIAERSIENNFTEAKDEQEKIPKVFDVWQCTIVFTKFSHHPLELANVV